MSDEPRVTSRLFRGYGPLVGFVAAMVIMANVVPTARQEVSSDGGFVDDGTEVAVAGEVDEASSTTVTTDDTLPGADPSVTETTAGASGTTGGGGSAGRAGTRGGTTGRPGTGGPAARGGSSDAAAGRVPCTDRQLQVARDTYSPPCYQWTGGDNGGATFRGVTGNEIVVAVRIDTFLSGLNDALSKAAGADDLREDPEVVKRTFTGLAEYFNRTYQFYGRKLRLVFFSGKGDPLKEALGGGQEGAQADALKVATEIKAFADISAVTPPYADALSRRGVVNVGAPYVSRDWLTRRRPFAWTTLTDCSTVVESVGSYYVNRLSKRPAAYAAGDLKGKPRTAGIIAPENDWYQECVAAGVRVVQQGGAGGELRLNEKYQLDLNKMSTQAASLVSKFKGAGVTTVICGCDPVLLSFLTKQAEQQAYQPEWVVTGVAFTDQDLVGQLFDQTAWSRALGVSFSGPPQPLRGSFAYAAYKSTNTPGEPSIAAEIIYYQMQLLAIGIQMAGPNLNPETFEAGMFAYPQRTGRAGLWNFGPGDYSTSADAREVYWNSNAQSIQNGKRGAYIEAEPGKRYPIGKWPTGDPPVPAR
jgi:hypothetical protein